MEEEKKLYPFKLAPIEETAGETVLLADLGDPDSQIVNGWLAANTLSEVMDMYMDRVVGENVFPYFGRQFPIFIRRIHGDSRSPLIVHPDDETAAERFDFLGKAKLWYVAAADPGAELYLGFNREVSASEFYSSCQNDSVLPLMNVVHPSAGDCFFIPPGTVHASGKGVDILEIAESSPLDFRIHDWNGNSSEAVAEALGAAFDFISFGSYCPQPSCAQEGPARKLVGRPEFTVSEIRLNEPQHVICEQFGSFIVYVCLNGGASINIAAESGPQDGIGRWQIEKGEVVLVPAEIADFYLVPDRKDTLIVETVLEPRREDILN